MPEELQGLLDQIRRDGVDKARNEADAIVAAAKEQARTIGQKAGEEAAAIVARAGQESRLLEERSRKALEQAARDLILSVGAAIRSLLNSIVKKEVSQALTAETIKDVLGGIMKAYAGQTAGTTPMDVLVSPAQQKQLADYFLGRFKAELPGGLQVRADPALSSGFRISMRDRNVEHDFSGPAIAEALGQLLRPELAEIVNAAAKQAGK